MIAVRWVVSALWSDAFHLVDLRSQETPPGVALAAIHGLSQKPEDKLRERDREIEQLKQMVKTLAAKLEALTRQS